MLILCRSWNELTVFFIFLKAMYMFYALALVCDDYFVPSLEKICEVTISAIKKKRMTNQGFVFIRA